MKLKLIIFFILTFTTRIVIAQGAWTFKTESSGIKVYVDNKSAMKVKPIKVESSINATPTQIAAVLLDVENYPDWVYKIKSTSLVKQTSATDLFYYAEINMPWPAQNRDFAAHITVTQNPETKVITIDAPSVADLVPEKEDLTRVKRSHGKWILIPDGNNKTKVTYYFTLEPDGGAPAWIINLFITDGPMQSFKKLKVQVQKPAYRNAANLFR
ncbi:START domain-containing protein [Mucilaginibacter panaciglaebae]|uniref:START domain-containing protein n=1 Tax=Mucilaginibacter panaciglaebae TaxID=502331 RepID=A0ABP7X484_9SPHI